MELSEAVCKRRIVRHFTAEPVAPEIIDRMLDLARHAPSAGFTQGQSFIVVTRPELKREIARLCGEDEGYVRAGFHPFISEAPVLVIACTSEAAYHQRYQEADKLKDDGSEIEWPVPYWHMDIGCAVRNCWKSSKAGTQQLPLSSKLRQQRLSFATTFMISSPSRSGAKGV